MCLKMRNCLWGFVNNKWADQPAHLRRLTNAFVVHVLESIISRLVTSEITVFELVSVAEEICVSLTLLEIPKTGFVALRPIYVCGVYFFNMPQSD